MHPMHTTCIHPTDLSPPPLSGVLVWRPSQKKESAQSPTGARETDLLPGIACVSCAAGSLAETRGPASPMGRALPALWRPLHLGGYRAMQPCTQGWGTAPACEGRRSHSGCCCCIPMLQWVRKY